MSTYNDTLRKHRRLAILRHLEACSEYTSNASILTDILNGVGVISTRSQVVTDLSWLKENGFVSYDDRAEFIVVEATNAGIEIARGLSSHPEIQRPRPRA
ncbi:hypothetical protein [Celeribacter sp.]|uniref:VpaChn25_0724 family phage protein n=1 Tax=Celeribacter sp. TaxID=1890673 RepID=UPI003A9465E3